MCILVYFTVYLLVITVTSRLLRDHGHYCTTETTNVGAVDDRYDHGRYIPCLRVLATVVKIDRTVPHGNYPSSMLMHGMDGTMDSTNGIFHAGTNVCTRDRTYMYNLCVHGNY